MLPRLHSLDPPTDPISARHCNCVYYHDWHRTKRPKRANDGGGLLPGVSHALSPLPPSSVAGSAPGSAPGTPFSSPRNTLASNSGVIVALGDGNQSPGVPARTATPPLVQAQGGAAGAVSSAGLPFDEEAKLVYGVILSLRNMVKRLSGRYASLPSLLPQLPFEIIKPISVSCGILFIDFIMHMMQGRVVCQLPHVDVQAAPLRNGLGLSLRHVE